MSQPRRSLILAVCAVLLASIAPAAVIPTPEQRERNYGRGSCAHAAMTTLLRMHGRTEGADWWRETYRGPEPLQRLAARARGAGLAVDATFNGDASFLDRVDCAVIDFGPTGTTRHAVVFCGYAGSAGSVAIISDPNKTSRLQCYPKDEFIAYWKRCGGRAVALK